MGKTKEMEQQKSTDELDKLLNEKGPEELEQYLSEHGQYLRMYGENPAQDERSFYRYMKEVLHARNRKLKDVYIAIGMSEDFAGKILRMEKRTASRDLIIKICLAGHFNLVETNRALKLYGMSELYAKERRDACIIVAINKNIFDPYEVDDILRKHGFKVLMKDEQWVSGEDD